MKHGMRALIGLALLGGASPGPAAAPAPASTSTSTSTPASSATFQAVLARDLLAIVNDAHHPLASLSVLAIRHGKVRYEQQFGLRRIDPAGLAGAPANASTMFRIASISKMMTTLGAMKLVEDGKLSLDADLGPYLGFALRNPAYPHQTITLRMLLSHTSSLRDEGGYSWGAGTALKEVLVPGARLYGEGAMWAKNGAPGSYFTYSNLNWGVIGTLMEKVTGERFDRLMKRLLLTPMGLRGGYNPSEFSLAELADTATLYRKRGTDSELWNASGPWIAQVDDYALRPPAAPHGIAGYAIGSNGTLFSPTGGLRISAADLGKIMRMLLNHGRHQGKQILKPDTIALMFAEQWRADGDGDRAGNGDTSHGLFKRWNLGNQRFDNLPGKGNGLVDGARFSAAGHLGDAYGLRSIFVLLKVIVGKVSTAKKLGERRSASRRSLCVVMLGVLISTLICALSHDSGSAVMVPLKSANAPRTLLTKWRIWKFTLE